MVGLLWFAEHQWYLVSLELQRLRGKIADLEAKLPQDAGPTKAEDWKDAVGKLEKRLGESIRHEKRAIAKLDRAVEKTKDSPQSMPVMRPA